MKNTSIQSELVIQNKMRHNHIQTGTNTFTQYSQWEKSALHTPRKTFSIIRKTSSELVRLFFLLLLCILPYKMLNEWNTDDWRCNEFYVKLCCRCCYLLPRFIPFSTSFEPKQLSEYRSKKGSIICIIHAISINTDYITLRT